MKISIAINDVIKAYGSLDEACLNIKEAGFTHVDFQLTKQGVKDSVFFNEDIDVFLDYFKEARKIVEKNGLIVNQTHAPFGLDEEVNLFTEEFENLIVRSIIATNALGAKYVVVHPVRMQTRFQFNLEHAFNKNYEQMKKFIPYLEKYDVKIALENLYIHDPMRKNFFVPTVLSSADDMVKMLNKLGDNFVACFDTGHCNISSMEPIYDMVKKLGSHIGVLHITDNNKILDDHLIPFAGRVDWDGFIKAMREINFKGVYSYELVFREPKELILPRLKYIAENAKYIARQIEGE